MSAELEACFVCGRPSTRPGGHPRCALNAAKPQPSCFPVGQRVRVTAGRSEGRAGVVVYLGNLGDDFWRYVLLDPRPRERSEKTVLVPITKLAREAP